LVDARPLCRPATQELGDYVLAHGYVRKDHVLDEELPLWVPIPALAEMQVALEQAVAEVTGLTGFELKRVMRTGTVASVDNQNWELGDHISTIRRLSQSRAVALDMESATVAANGFRFRVPYGTLLCVSDKPLHGEIIENIRDAEFSCFSFNDVTTPTRQARAHFAAGGNRLLWCRRSGWRKSQ
jgi:nucleoside phosphorylase